VVYYCGSNDLKAKDADAPEVIFSRFREFSERVRARFPATDLVYVTATRSPDRVAIWEQVDHYNALARAYCAATPRRHFIDLNPVLVDAQGHPRLELYQKDKLHFHPPAYAEFARVIRPVLERLWAQPAP
jgi:lysophospholipase L1-like esterase